MLRAPPTNTSEKAASVCGYVVYQPVFILWTSVRLLIDPQYIQNKLLIFSDFPSMHEFHARTPMGTIFCTPPPGLLIQVKVADDVAATIHTGNNP
jgi:hypothetical protein